MCIKKACAVIAAAGSGNRMGGISKPNIEILGKTLFEYVLEAFDDSCVCEIVVVCSEDNELSLRALTGERKKPVIFTRGGATRAESIANGIGCASKDCEIICTHDCARPFVTSKIIDETIKEATIHGASCVCSPVTDTVKHKDPITGFVSTPERANMFAVQTPQCFKKSLYLYAKNALCDRIADFTDESSILEEIGVEVCYIKTEGTNIKLTSPDDIPIAEILMKRKEAYK